MELNESQWHVKLYLWCRQTWNTFRDDNDWYEQHNLCMYVRSVLIWAPFALLSQVALIAWAGYVFIYYPVTRIGWTGLAYEVAAVVAIVGIVYLIKLIIMGINKLDDAYQNRRDERLASMEGDEPLPLKKATNPKKRNGPGFIEVIFNFLVALHDKTCPSIKIVSSKKE